MTTTDTIEVFDEQILSVEGDVAHLRGSYCAECDRHYFPAKRQCPVCGAQVEARQLPASGVIYSHTTLMRPLTVHPVPTTIVQVAFDLPELVLATAPLVSGEPEIGASVNLVPNRIQDLEQGDYLGFGWARANGESNA